AALYHCLNPAYTSQAWQTEFPRFGTALIDAAIATGARLVCLDNLYAYGPVDAALTEDTPLAPAGSKGRVRGELSRALADAAATRGLRYTVGRAGDFFGPGVEQSVMSITPIRAGRSSWLVGDPQAVHAFSYAPDVARGLAALGTAAADVVEGRTFHLPVLELAPAELHRRLGEAVGVRAGYRTLGPLGIRLLGLFVPVVRELPETYYQWARPFRVDDRRFRASFPDIGTPLDQAVRETAAA
ncbi:MAG: NAD-dependent epimerase/dehydratase family protein, partial [Myxococcota bacterium]